VSENRHKIGQEVMVSVSAVVTDISDAHGLCYEVELTQRDYSNPRTIWLEPDELQSFDA
jgi:hypothetical protein